MVREEIGGFHPGKFFSGLLRIAEKAGVSVSFNNKVTEILDRKTGGKSIVTSMGTINTGKVIVATNAYTGRKYNFTKFLRQRPISLSKYFENHKDLFDNYMLQIYINYKVLIHLNLYLH